MNRDHPLVRWSTGLSVVGVLVTFAFLITLVIQEGGGQAELARTVNGPCPASGRQPSVACQQLQAERAAHAADSLAAAQQRTQIQSKLDEALAQLAALRAQFEALGVTVPPLAGTPSPSRAAETPRTGPGSTPGSARPSGRPSPAPSGTASPRPSPRPTPIRTPTPVPCIPNPLPIGPRCLGASA